MLGYFMLVLCLVESVHTLCPDSNDVCTCSGKCSDGLYQSGTITCIIDGLLPSLHPGNSTGQGMCIWKTVNLIINSIPVLNSSIFNPGFALVFLNINQNSTIPIPFDTGPLLSNLDYVVVVAASSLSGPLPFTAFDNDDGIYLSFQGSFTIDEPLPLWKYPSSLYSLTLNSSVYSDMPWNVFENLQCQDYVIDIYNFTVIKSNMFKFNNTGGTLQFCNVERIESFAINNSAMEYVMIDVDFGILPGGCTRKTSVSLIEAHAFHNTTLSLFVGVNEVSVFQDQCIDSERQASDAQLGLGFTMADQTETGINCENIGNLTQYFSGLSVSVELGFPSPDWSIFHKVCGFANRLNALSIFYNGRCPDTECVVSMDELSYFPLVTDLELVGPYKLTPGLNISEHFPNLTDDLDFVSICDASLLTLPSPSTIELHFEDYSQVPPDPVRLAFRTQQLSNFALYALLDPNQPTSCSCSMSWMLQLRDCENNMGDTSMDSYLKQVQCANQNSTAIDFLLSDICCDSTESPTPTPNCNGSHTLPPAVLNFDHRDLPQCRTNKAWRFDPCNVQLFYDNPLPTREAPTTSQSSTSSSHIIVPFTTLLSTEGSSPALASTTPSTSTLASITTTAATNRETTSSTSLASSSHSISSSTQHAPSLSTTSASTIPDRTSLALSSSSTSSTTQSASTSSTTNTLSSINPKTTSTASLVSSPSPTKSTQTISTPSTSSSTIAEGTSTAALTLASPSTTSTTPLISSSSNSFTSSTSSMKASTTTPVSSPDTASITQLTTQRPATTAGQSSCHDFVDLCAIERNVIFGDPNVASCSNHYFVCAASQCYQLYCPMLPIPKYFDTITQRCSRMNECTYVSTTTGSTMSQTQTTTHQEIPSTGAVTTTEKRRTTTTASFSPPTIQISTSTTMTPKTGFTATPTLQTLTTTTSAEQTPHTKSTTTQSASTESLPATSTSGSILTTTGSSSTTMLFPVTTTTESTVPTSTASIFTSTAAMKSTSIQTTTINPATTTPAITTTTFAMTTETYTTCDNLSDICKRQNNSIIGDPDNVTCSDHYFVCANCQCHQLFCPQYPIHTYFDSLRKACIQRMECVFKSTHEIITTTTTKTSRSSSSTPDTLPSSTTNTGSTSPETKAPSTTSTSTTGESTITSPSIASSSPTAPNTTTLTGEFTRPPNESTNPTTATPTLAATRTSTTSLPVTITSTKGPVLSSTAKGPTSSLQTTISATSGSTEMPSTTSSLPIATCNDFVDQCKKQRNSIFGDPSNNSCSNYFFVCSDYFCYQLLCPWFPVQTYFDQSVQTCRQRIECT